MGGEAPRLTLERRQRPQVARGLLVRPALDGAMHAARVQQSHEGSGSRYLFASEVASASGGREGLPRFSASRLG